MQRAAPRCLAGILAGLVLCVLLAGCRVGVGAVRRQIVVDFVSANSAAAATVVKMTCAGLPGTAILTIDSADPSVHFDITHASDRQVIALTECISTLAANSSLQIRGYRIEDGEGS